MGRSQACVIRQSGDSEMAEATTQATLQKNLVRYLGVKCGYVYDPAHGDHSQGVAPGVDVSALPADWRCLKCKAVKEKFLPET